MRHLSEGDGDKDAKLHILCYAQNIGCNTFCYLLFILR